MRNQVSTVALLVWMVFCIPTFGQSKPAKKRQLPAVDSVRPNLPGVERPILDSDDSLPSDRPAIGQNRLLSPETFESIDQPVNASADFLDAAEPVDRLPPMDAPAPGNRSHGEFDSFGDKMFSLSFAVKTPDGDPAVGVLMEEYVGEPIEITFDDEGKPQVLAGQRMQNYVAPAASEVEKAKLLAQHQSGTFEVLIKESGTKFVVVHETGYAIYSNTVQAAIKKAKSFPDGIVPITLKPWGVASATVLFNGKPMPLGRVIARWESFPFSPAMMRLTAEERRAGPPLISITQTVETKEAGRYELSKLPPGRARLSAITAPQDLEKVDISNTMLGTISWWRDIKPAGQDELPHEHEFATITVKGRIKMTDELLRRRVVVKSTPQGVEVTEAELRVAFTEPSSFDEWQHIEERSLEDAIREAVVWGRPDGKREVEYQRGGAVAVDDNGAFECTLLESSYNVHLMLPIKDDAHSHSGVPLRWATIATDIATVSQEEVRDTEIDLGEIDVALRSDLHDDFATSRDPRELDDPFESRIEQELQRRDARVFQEQIDRQFGQRPRGRDSNDRREELPHQTRNGDSPLELPDRDAFADDSWDPNSFESAKPKPADTSRNVQPIPYALKGQLGSYDSRATGGYPQNSPSLPLPAPASPVDQSIAQLVTELLAAGDRRTRDNMRKPLQELLEKKFDAEQQAREALVRQLSERLKEASKQVTDRKKDRDRIVREQLGRMMSLPEDSFLPMEPVEPLRPPEPMEDARDFLESPLPGRLKNPVQDPRPAVDTANSLEAPQRFGEDPDQGFPAEPMASPPTPFPDEPFVADALPAQDFPAERGDLVDLGPTVKFDVRSIEPHFGPLKKGNWDGRVMVLHFRQEYPSKPDETSAFIERLHDQYGKYGVAVVEVMPNDDTLWKAQPWTVTSGTFSQRHPGVEIPCTFVIDHHGYHRHIADSECPHDEIVSAVENLLREESREYRSASREIESLDSRVGEPVEKQEAAGSSLRGSVDRDRRSSQTNTY